MEEEVRRMEVEAGIHFWCACGRSGHPPFCDGSHKGSGFQPVKLTVGEKTTIFWRICPESGLAVRCEGP